MQMLSICWLEVVEMWSNVDRKLCKYWVNVVEMLIQCFANFCYNDEFVVMLNESMFCQQYKCWVDIEYL